MGGGVASDGMCGERGHTLGAGFVLHGWYIDDQELALTDFEGLWMAYRWHVVGITWRGGCCSGFIHRRMCSGMEEGGRD